MQTQFKLVLSFPFLVLSWALPPSLPAPTALGLSTFVPKVEADEEVYRYEPANNGAGPLWCSGSTCLVRIGERVFASGLETIPEAKPLNNCRWLLFERDNDGWKLREKDATGRTREPCPLACFSDGRLFLSGNPTLTSPETYNGPARPEILQFDATMVAAGAEHILPIWEGSPPFSEHSYRSFAADGPNHELIIFQNIGYTHAEWSFRDRPGRWTAGKLVWPFGTNYAKPQPIRVCYPDVALKQRAVHFCGVSDIVEPNPEWRAFKRQLTGQEWDYDFRRLFYTWTPDITRTGFRDWVELASRERTCGWISPGDLWVAPDGEAHILWTERAVDERLREKFFPTARQNHSLQYAILRSGKVALQRTLLETREGKPGLIASSPRFHVTSDYRLFVVFFAQGQDGEGKSVSENRVMEIHKNGRTGAQLVIPLKHPFTSFFTAGERGGSAPSEFIEMLGQREGQPNQIGYARLKLR